MPNKKRFRTEPARGLAEGKNGVDKESNVIRGFAVISEGEAKGHGMLVDATTLSQVIEHGNKAKHGVRSRFGHPNMSSEALGTFIGRAKNFRADGKIVRADLHIDDSAFNSPNGDLGSYVMQLAETDPDAFGTSIVFEGDREYPKDEKGKDVTHDENGVPTKPFARVKFLYAVDAVDEPAANEGFFSASVQLSAEVSDRLSMFLDDEDAVENGVSFLRRYCANAGMDESDVRLRRVAEMFAEVVGCDLSEKNRPENKPENKLEPTQTKEEAVCLKNSKPTSRKPKTVRIPFSKLPKSTRDRLLSTLRPTSGNG